MKNGWIETTSYSIIRTHYVNDIIHKDDGPAKLVGADRYWYRNGLEHREDGPAYEGCLGTRKWFLNGKQHRIDGPAVHYVNRAGIATREDLEEYWIYGQKIDCKTQEEFERIVKLISFF